MAEDLHHAPSELIEIQRTFTIERELADPLNIRDILSELPEILLNPKLKILVLLNTPK